MFLDVADAAVNKEDFLGGPTPYEAVVLGVAPLVAYVRVVVELWKVMP